MQLLADLRVRLHGRARGEAAELTEAQERRRVEKQLRAVEGYSRSRAKTLIAKRTSKGG